MAKPFLKITGRRFLRARTEGTEREKFRDF